MICDHLGRRGIAVSREVGDLTAADLWTAAHSSTAGGRPRPIDLGLGTHARASGRGRRSSLRSRGGRVA